MDFDDGDGGTWKWQDMDCSLPEGPRYEISPLTEVTTNQEDKSYMTDDGTPVKACVDVSVRDNLMKESEECKVNSSQSKRRRMLQFTNEAMEFPLCTEELPSFYLKSKAREESVESLLPEISPWEDPSSDSMSTPNFEMMEPDQWLAELLNDTDMTEDTTFLEEASDFQFDISDIDVARPNHEAEARPVEHCAPPPPKPAPKRVTGKVIFKGRKSYIQAPIKLASSVAYPFTFIKPCPAKGGMTLDDINQKIHTPPKKPDPIPPNLPKSAFSGKLVVGKTRIRTEGGKGSITIMRTRG
uniref:Protein XRI1 n=1 Tax=Kalanchoe fedtschenkoi TaxID=63787 RepID=A0A7N0UQF1_KALFE